MASLRKSDNDEFDDDWLDNLAIIELKTREKGFKDGYKVGEQIAANLGLNTAVEVAPDPGFEFGCLHAFSRIFLQELKTKEGESKNSVLVSLLKEIVHKTEVVPEDVLQVSRDLDGIKFKLGLYESEFPILKSLAIGTEFEKPVQVEKPEAVPTHPPVKQIHDDF